MFHAVADAPTYAEDDQKTSGGVFGNAFTSIAGVRLVGSTRVSNSDIFGSLHPPPASGRPAQYASAPDCVQVAPEQPDAVGADGTTCCLLPIASIRVIPCEGALG